MKKIVGLLAAAAVLATSVFAADVAAKVRVTGDIFNLDNTVVNEKGEAASALKLFRAATVSHWYDAPYVTLSTSTDNAGGNVQFVTGDDGSTNLGVDKVQVWFKPIDVLKIQAGDNGFNMNTETIDYTNISGNAETFGYSLGFAQDALSITAVLGTGNNGWFFEDAQAKYGTKEEPATSYVKDLYTILSYSADFGKISAFFEYQGKNLEGTKEAFAETPDFSKLKYNPTVIKFGAGYSNTIDNLTFFADVVGTSKSAATDKEMDLAKDYALAQLAAGKSGDDLLVPGIAVDKDGKARSAFGLAFDAFAAYSADALTVKGYVVAKINDFGQLNEKKDGTDIMYANNFELGLKARVDYKLDNGIGLYAYFGSGNLLKKAPTYPEKKPFEVSVFESTIKVGASGSVGICGWETWLQLDTGKSVASGKDAGKFDKVNVKMPVYIQVAF